MENVINKGIIQEKTTGIRFVFRQMLDMPIGLSYLYMLDKTPEIVQMEMRILNNGDRTAPVYFKTINKAFPIFWEDDMPEIPVSCLNVYSLLEGDDWGLLDIDEEFRDTHIDLLSIYQKYSK